VAAISLGLCFNVVVPSTNGGRDGIDVALAVAQVSYGILAFAVVSLNQAEPVGVYILRLLTILVGLPIVFFLGSLLPEFLPGFFPHEGTSRGDVASRFAALAVLCGFVTGLLIVATGVSLLIPRLKRFRTVVALMMAAAVAELALATCALLGALLGHSKGGLLEGALLLVALPFAVVLLLLTAAGVWYVRRLDIRRALETDREQRL
jgi:hypothetical protein